MMRTGLTFYPPWSPFRRFSSSNRRYNTDINFSHIKTKKELLSRPINILGDTIIPENSELLKLSLSEFLPTSCQAPPYGLNTVLSSNSQAFPSGQSLKNIHYFPQGHHLVYFPTRVPTSQILPDGTDQLHSPGAPFVRRMWAGGSLHFNNHLNSLFSGKRLGALGATCLEKITNVTIKGALNDEKIFVEIERHYLKVYKPDLNSGKVFPKWGSLEITAGGIRRDVSIAEKRTLVFMRNIGHVEQNGNSSEDDRFVKPPELPQFHMSFVPTPSLLFRFSALTFNAHLIHTSPQYASEVEGYRNTLVHGPLTVILMLSLLRGQLNDGEMVSTFDYQNLAPLYANEMMKICGTRRADGTFRLWIENSKGSLAVRGIASITSLKLESAFPREQAPSLRNTQRPYWKQLKDDLESLRGKTSDLSLHNKTLRDHNKTLRDHNKTLRGHTKTLRDRLWLFPVRKVTTMPALKMREATSTSEKALQAVEINRVVEGQCQKLLGKRLGRSAKQPFNTRRCRTRPSFFRMREGNSSEIGPEERKRLIRALAVRKQRNPKFPVQKVTTKPALKMQKVTSTPDLIPEAPILPLEFCESFESATAEAPLKRRTSSSKPAFGLKLLQFDADLQRTDFDGVIKAKRTPRSGRRVRAFRAWRQAVRGRAAIERMAYTINNGPFVRKYPLTDTATARKVQAIEKARKVRARGKARRAKRAMEYYRNNGPFVLKYPTTTRLDRKAQAIEKARKALAIAKARKAIRAVRRAKSVATLKQRRVRARKVWERMTSGSMYAFLKRRLKGTAGNAVAKDWKKHNPYRARERLRAMAQEPPEQQKQQMSEDHELAKELAGLFSGADQLMLPKSGRPGGGSGK